jgi:hypothetical protein
MAVIKGELSVTELPNLFRRQTDRDANISRKFDPNEKEVPVRTHVHKKYYEFYLK